jgi:hypothetical protein
VTPRLCTCLSFRQILDLCCRYAEEHAKRLNPFAMTKLEAAGAGTPVCAPPTSQLFYLTSSFFFCPQLSKTDILSLDISRLLMGSRSARRLVLVYVFNLICVVVDRHDTF